MMALAGYRPGAWAEAQSRAKVLPRRTEEATRPCLVCLAPFVPLGPRLYACCHECSAVLRRERKRRTDAERMARLRAEKKNGGAQ